MYKKLQPVLEKELNSIREAGLYKKERIITTPQAADIKTQDGKIYGGTNIENASLSLTLCAERVAIFKAVSEGHKSFTDLALVSSNGQPIFPCGACRQVLMEFSPEIQIHQEGNDNKSISLRDLLPNPFGLKDFKNPT